jgi:Predicted metal-dependent hydrolase with the TIM-barrel fold
VKYKTNLIRYIFKTNLLILRYGGHGYSYISKFVKLLEEIGLDPIELKQILKENPLSLFNWWKPIKVKEVYVVMWKCHW